MATEDKKHTVLLATLGAVFNGFGWGFRLMTESLWIAIAFWAVSIVVFIIAAWPFLIGLWSAEDIHTQTLKERRLTIVGLITGFGFLGGLGGWIAKRPEKIIFATPSELSGKYISNLPFKLVDLRGDDGWIREKTVVNCEIYGPAVIWGLTTDLVSFKDSEFNKSGYLIVKDSNKIPEHGLIYLADCHFRDCNFYECVIAGDEEGLNIIKQNNQFKP